MKKEILAIATAATLVLAGCENMTQQQRDELSAGLFGAGAAGIASRAIFDASAGWVVVAAAAGAAAGVLIARNSNTGQCAYADGSGGHTTGPC